MPEYISRETLRDLMYTEAFDRDTGLQRWDSGLWIRFKLFENCLDAIPAADVVEVVRCRECMYYHDYTCDRWADGTFMESTDYCSRAAKMDGGQDDV